ncbi:hypothetical protein FZEAL_6715 [Fusarium zealandicum]|uniref:Mannan endo-1,6-alpha-mannosidase n=1 Tax=Fusarium zealandicum TaxID=1053134 RepID=A0A8H4UHZ8_9HYPO|nr:hypothetical protein FZEAL_6715 [Fusarium zealandicum]
MVAIQKLSGAGASSLLLLITQSMLVHSLQIDDKDDILKTSKTLAADLMSFYHGNESGEIPGLLPEDNSKKGEPPTGYFWYQSGAFMSSYIDYWQLTGDETYNDIVKQGMLWQTGQNKDFLPANQTMELGNDDQAVWAMGALTASEYGFPNPHPGDAQWLDLAVSVWETQRLRWDAEIDNGTCKGGLRWQIAPFNAGYDYKNTASNGFFFSLGARLARLTRNETFADYAEQTWDWMYDTKLINNKTWAVYDGTKVEEDCSVINKLQFSPGAASLTMGAAFMYNYTDGSNEWKERVEKITKATLGFFFEKKGYFEEASCSSDNTCPRDLPTYEALSLRWFAVASQVAPFMSDKILPYLANTAEKSEAKKKGKGALEQTLATFAAVSNLLIADSPALRMQNETDKSKDNKTDDDSGSGSSGSTSENNDGDAENNGSAAYSTGLAVILPVCLLFMSLL